MGFHEGLNLSKSMFELPRELRDFLTKSQSGALDLGPVVAALGTKISVVEVFGALKYERQETTLSEVIDKLRTLFEAQRPQAVLMDMSFLDVAQGVSHYSAVLSLLKVVPCGIVDFRRGNPGLRTDTQVIQEIVAAAKKGGARLVILPVPEVVIQLDDASMVHFANLQGQKKLEGATAGDQRWASDILFKNKIPLRDVRDAPNEIMKYVEELRRKGDNMYAKQLEEAVQIAQANFDEMQRSIRSRREKGE